MDAGPLWTLGRWIRWRKWFLMAVTAADLTTCIEMVISLLQASKSVYPAATVDGSNAQYASTAEITNQLLVTDGELCTLICNTLGHPYQTPFVITGNAQASGTPLPARIGEVLQILCLAGTGDVSFASTDVSVPNSTISIAGQSNNLVTGTRVQFTTSGILPTGLVIATNYYVDASLGTNLYRFATSRMNAFNGIFVTFSGAGSGTSTVVAQYEVGTQAMSKDEILGAIHYPTAYATQSPYLNEFWFIEGDIVYTPSPLCKIVYADYAQTSVLQAPQSYTNAIVGGAIARILKDGGDDVMAQYYDKVYGQMYQQIGAGAMTVPQISSYVLAQQ